MPQAISWWAHMYARCRQTLGAGRDESSGNSGVRNLHSIANINLRPIFTPFKQSAAEENQSCAISYASNTLTAATKKRESFQNFFIDQCRNHFFALSGLDAEKIKHDLINSNKTGCGEPITLYACTYYIIKCYIQLNRIENKEAAKSFIHFMQKLSKLMIEDQLDKKSRFASDVKGSMMPCPYKFYLLREINKSIIALFGNTSGPCNETIEMLLNSHVTPGSCHNHREIFRHEDVESNYIKTKSIPLRNERFSGEIVVSGERLISMIGIRSLNLCLKICQPPRWERPNGADLPARDNLTISL